MSLFMEPPVIFQFCKMKCLLGLLSAENTHTDSRKTDTISNLVARYVPRSCTYRNLIKCFLSPPRVPSQNTHSAKLVPIIVNHLQSSRSKEIRRWASVRRVFMACYCDVVLNMTLFLSCCRYCCEFVKHMLFVWPREALEKHAGLLQDAIKRGIADADPEARALSRQYVTDRHLHSQTYKQIDWGTGS